MEIKDLLKTEVMILDLQATSKEAVIDEMVNKLVSEGYVNDFATFKAGIMAREAQTSTGLGDGIAMPHSKNTAVNEPVVLFAKSKVGVDYAALDGQPVNLFFMIAAPDGANDTHLEALAQLSTYLLKDGFQDRLRKVEYPREVIQLFSEKQEEIKTVENAEHYIVAVTACTTGIAHTYMAEEALKKQALEMGVGIKVETNGARGIDNKLSAADIQKADAVIVAADKKVEMNRFAGKEMVQVPVAHAIRDTEELINRALSGKAPIYEADGSDEVKEESSGGLGKAFYKHLMGGVSAMLPFVVGGGILIALAFLIDQAMGVPQSQLANLGVYHPLAAYFKNVGGAAFAFMLPVLAGFIANSIADKPGLVAGFVAGSMASSGLAFGHLDPAKMIPSGFLGALVGGFLAGGVIILLRKAFAKLPRSLDGIKAILIYPLVGTFITGFLMLFVNIPMAAINTGLSNFLASLSGASALVLGLVVGGMMAIDLGGPINKAAYIFATGTLAATVSTGGSVTMAAVMAGGMVPPLATTVAVILFKNKFTKEERNAGLTNIVMGLSFITEGSIPFGASDPARAIPSFMVGAAVAGGLTGMANIKLMAPHGGVFVLALTNNPLLYLLFILIGAIVSGLLFGALKKAK
ncbi:MULTISPECIES: PTS fructose transporter subunit IIABC [Lactococcus]|uniref:Fructose-specific PTS transporter subunit EIIC n=1 Tax=Lactococcus lactis TaxID=1358 RepID=A0A9X4S2P4_9LACT|nr:fructose-specific PTS transporter subunit EIIC [Lactococcus lactis]KSU12131.1 PTS system fructose-specific IIA/B/C component [Lactococcus lactis subsp. lactis]MCT3132369.1 PTS fructose transporter subunit IIC [Lactococcus lactis]MCZ8490085.1 fructose-specific PTS transporter subunit EIIC [Lactococcus lactis]MDG4981292.1 fructose-specific PTS transporter subunit EIIC [Lactococcus lactis]MDT2851043.1 fructose-specific PTS transporter subunit EIIC [Lactococcus lactis]